MMAAMNASIKDETQQSAADAAAIHWQRIAQVLDQKAAMLGAGMRHYLSDDLSELLPRAQPIAYVHGTPYNAATATTAFAALAGRLDRAMKDFPPHAEEVADPSLTQEELQAKKEQQKAQHEQEQKDKRLFEKNRAPLFAAFLRADYPQEKQLALEALKRQMGEAACAYAIYAQRMMEDSFPRNTIPAPTTSTRELCKAIEQPLMRAYCCMEMLSPSVGETVMGLTDNRVAIMQAFEFMKDTANAEIRTQLAPPEVMLPKTAPQPVIQATTTRTQPPPDHGKKPMFGEQKPTSAAELARLRAEALARNTPPQPEKKGWFGR